MLKNLLLLAGAAWAIATGAAATLSLSPGNIPYDSTNTITLTVGGIANGQAVLIEEFSDDNANGLVDTGEQLIMRLAIHDGQISTLPPSSTVNPAGDEDGATNGAITKVLRLGTLAERARVAGTYVFRLSASDASFPSVSTPFVISPGNHPQAVTGTVLSEGVAVPFAFVGLLGDGEDSELAAGAVSDASGNFIVRAPVGDYGMIALKEGYVFDFGTAPGVSLVAATTNTQNLSLVAATHSISGSVVDAVTSNGIGGLQIFAQSQQGFATLAFTDANGDFSVPVVGDMWEVEVSDLSAAVAGYGRDTGHADTTSGNVAGLRLALSRALGRFQLVFFFPSGSFNDGTNGAISFPTRLNYYFANYNVDDDNAPTNVIFSGPAGSGLSNSPSDYFFGGNGEGNSASYTSRSIQVPGYPPGGSYVVSYGGYPQTFVLAEPEADNRQVLIVPRAVVNAAGELHEIRWVYRNATGSLIAPPAYMQSIEVRIDGETGQLYNGDASPGGSTHALSSPVPWADVRSVQTVYNDDLGNQYVAFWTRGTQPLQIHSQSLPNASVGSPCDYVFVASGGRAPYSWTMVSGSLPGGVNFASPAGELAGIPQANGTSNFRLRLMDDAGQSDERDFSLIVGGGTVTPPRLEMRPTGIAGEFGLRLVGDVGRSYSVQYSTALPNWSTLMTTNLTSSFIDFVDRSATDQFRLYRVMLNP